MKLICTQHYPVSFCNTKDKSKQTKYLKAKNEIPRGLTNQIVINQSAANMYLRYLMYPFANFSILIAKHDLATILSSGFHQLFSSCFT